MCFFYILSKIRLNHRWKGRVRDVKDTPKCGPCMKHKDTMNLLNTGISPFTSKVKLREAKAADRRRERKKVTYFKNGNCPQSRGTLCSWRCHKNDVNILYAYF